MKAENTVLGWSYIVVRWVVVKRERVHLGEFRGRWGIAVIAPLVKTIRSSSSFVHHIDCGAHGKSRALTGETDQSLSNNGISTSQAAEAIRRSAVCWPFVSFRKPETIRDCLYGDEPRQRSHPTSDPSAHRSSHDHSRQEHGTW
ncbi:hypothetical protein HYQ46_005165 [Verticillium longisporum]|nr:hypothetical protein HYQ46_005165 [Verticillium longisporum]